MTPSQRVFVNTAVQYVKTIINMVLSLYIIRIVLLALGEEDFGIYSLIAGVIAMLSFLTNAMVSTTQRFVSFYQGKGDLDLLKRVFNNSLCVHIGLAFTTVLVLEFLTPVIFSGFLNVPVERLDAAKVVYQIAACILFLTFINSPFRALLVSHENIIYISIVEVLDAVVKLLLALLIPLVPFDRLVYFGLMMFAVQLFNFMAISIYCYINYSEAVFPNLRKIDKEYIFQLASFAGWTLYSSGCVLGRQQGIAVVLNRFAGPAINAAYGIGFQVASYTNFLAQSLINAVTPQIVKSEAAGDRGRALWLSYVTCKFIFFLLSMLCIPCMFEINTILSVWLKDVPNYTPFFCIMVMLTLLADALTIGLTYINQAIGNIKWYSIIMYTPKLITLPLFAIFLYFDLPFVVAASVYVSIELLCAILRLPFLKHTAGLNVAQFVKQVFCRELLPTAVITVSCSIITNYFAESNWRVLTTFSIAIASYVVAIWLCGLDYKEKSIISKILISRLRIYQ